MTNLEAKENNLIKDLASKQRVAIAYSGGIDSTYLLKVAVDELGKDNVLAMVVNSELFLDDEYNKALELAKDLGANAMGVSMSELADERIAANTPESWYYSKQLLYRTIKKAAAEKGFDIVLDGMIMDDNADFRPGMKARTEEGIVSSLQDADLYKSEIRELAKDRGISNWNKVASCSVASRFPYGTKLTAEAVNNVFAGEKWLRNAGFPVVRVRVHSDLVRVEVPEVEFAKLLAKKAEMSEFMKGLGFNYVTLDVDGFKSGRMNDVLKEEKKATLI
ncbi:MULTISPECIES: ATP-dependent sacrificial sulfur transferase LarE [Pediococcus]|uniref:ATP-utilizing enzyme of the PP-loop superfamily n=1 Tax=Pediococcus pentosaceus (strain ATCC 25745 / CCUG 21536 / LMG 10740 / 183-1w) TaxID=278197 RepID=Q03DL1_PEDPA|nr:MULTISPECIES: ATP-dependent sacrificial sulfur transferase LarE [Pediococcus]ABJ68711.1 ATP-utilizing enzyme of the PP-loop superfamily [Pediococcus pentosaceus ATCC 25745]AVL02126.1 TIGR00268 family protein [Pediococcus pentosaceus]KAF5440131.1 ATP-dependent sacrificial sulfur transferase LarE [Pediococcus sp. EKM202D]KAF5440424.1 ATP-dependent sacrificial sulfur transferase LarE [Pediococcus sp. EKM201D]MBF7134345.1 ATP-dependent sacrificial sulfur transferase LarE [Pediococcus pentosaceu